MEELGQSRGKKNCDLIFSEPILFLAKKELIDSKATGKCF